MIRVYDISDEVYARIENHLANDTTRVEKHNGVVNYKYSKESIRWLLDDLDLKGTITGGNYFETVNPFHVHTDTGKREELGDLKPKYNIVVPMAEDPSFNTVIFDQQWHGDASHFLVGSIYKYWPDPVYNLRKTDYEGVENLTSLPFNEDDYMNYLLHMPYETVQGLTIKQVVPWKKGQVLVFDSTLLHCSSYFNSKKLGLTVLVSDV
jgi:hypothetical protein